MEKKLNMAVVYFKKKTGQGTTLSAPIISGMHNDTNTLYFLTSTLNGDSDFPHSYLFFSGRSIAASPNPQSPFDATASDGKTYTLDKPYAFTPQYGTTINVKFASTNTASAPTLDGVLICRRLSSALMPMTINPQGLSNNTSYKLVYTKIGTVNYWVIQGMDRPAASDLYGTLPNSILEVSTTDIGAGATLASNKLYVVYS